jgi:pyruvate,water dikinase
MEWRSFFGITRKKQNLDSIRTKIQKFQNLLKENNHVLELIADAEESLGGDLLFDIQYLRSLADQLEESVKSIIFDLNFITENQHLALLDSFEKIRINVKESLLDQTQIPDAPDVLTMADVDMNISDAVGEKMARLGDIKKRLQYHVPDGFIVTSHACDWLFKEIRFKEKLHWVADLLKRNEISVKDAEKQLQGFILNQPLPKKLAKQILRCVSDIEKKQKAKILFAVRSSAIGEDSRLSFAGLHDSFLGIQTSGAIDAYKKVVASLFNSRAIQYRLMNNEPIQSAMMAVGFIQMVPATSAGVLYTLDPNTPDQNAIIVSAASGIGKTVVEGEESVDRFVISRNPPHLIISKKIVPKKKKYTVSILNGIEQIEIPPSQQSHPAVSDSFLNTLAIASLQIEKYMKSPQDIEWAQDDSGELIILQARPLKIKIRAENIAHKLRDEAEKHTVLISGRGTVACRGVGYGKVKVITDEGDLSDIPLNTVIVAHQSSPKLAELLPRANALVTDIGAPTGHLATIAREFRVPALMDMGNATEVLKNDMEVTIDAEENIIYEGKLEELLNYEILKGVSFEDSPEFRILRRMLKRIAPLNLKNPQASNFHPNYCRTYHDIVRFAHEKAVERLFEGHDLPQSEKSLHNRMVLLDVPIDLKVIDIGGGLSPFLQKEKTCSIQEIQCDALKSLLEGLTYPGAWSTESAGMDFGSFMASMARSSVVTESLVRSPQRNLAIISDQYLNLNLYLGYHFNQVDSFLSDARNDNYIYFRFAGGVTDDIRRSRRAQMIAIILQKQDFVVDRKRDFVVARLKKFERPVLLQKLWMIGYLIGFSRQMDVRMRDDTMIDKSVEEFMNEACFKNNN